jgi:hypothetical protein
VWDSKDGKVAETTRGEVRLLKAEDQEGSVTKAKFTADELAKFGKCFDRVPSWKNWERRDGAQGEDVLEIVVDSDTPAILKVAKTERSGYVATGFDGWGLTVCDDFDKLLDILARMSPSSGGSDLRSWTIDAAA